MLLYVLKWLENDKKIVYIFLWRGGGGVQKSTPRIDPFFQCFCVIRLG